MNSVLSVRQVFGRVFCLLSIAFMISYGLGVFTQSFWGKFVLADEHFRADLFEQDIAAAEDKVDLLDTQLSNIQAIESMHNWHKSPGQAVKDFLITSGLSPNAISGKTLRANWDVDLEQYDEPEQVEITEAVYRHFMKTYEDSEFWEELALLTEELGDGERNTITQLFKRYVEEGKWIAHVDMMKPNGNLDSMYQDISTRLLNLRTRFEHKVTIQKHLVSELLGGEGNNIATKAENSSLMVPQNLLVKWLFQRGENADQRLHTTPYSLLITRTILAIFVGLLLQMLMQGSSLHGL